MEFRRIPILSLFQRLLRLCRCWTHNSLHSILSFLALARKSGGPSKRCGGSEKRILPKVHDHSSSDIHESRTHIEGQSKSHGAMTLQGDRRSVVLACSTVPAISLPPRTHHDQQRVSADYPVLRPPTPLNSPGVLDLGNSAQHRFSSDHNTISRPAGNPNTAEPAHILAVPEDSKSMKCTTPSASLRYDRNITIKSISGPRKWVFEPLQTLNVYEKQIIPSWMSYTHPEGQIYFLNTSRGFHYLTEAHLYEGHILEQVENFVDEIEKKIREYHSDHRFPSNVEVVLEIGDQIWSYYLVDLDRCCIFWLDDYDAEVLIPPTFGIEAQEHFHHLLNGEYWLHIEHFPSHRQLMKGTLEELLGILNFCKIDYATSSDSTAPYKESETESLIASVKHFQALHESGYSSGNVVAGSARIMVIIANERFHNFYGFNGARLTVTQSVRGDNLRPRSWLIKLLSPALFYAPDTHLSRLEDLWVDGVIKQRRWKIFQEKLERDWEGFVLYATVLLNANVAFLAIPAVTSNNSSLWESPAAIASKASIIASLGSITVGLLLVRQLRTRSRDLEYSASDAIGYLQRRRHPQLGLETMAIQYSLPYALLMWGMATFLTSVAMLCFLNVDDTTSILARASYGCGWIVIVVLILWTVLTGWETTNNLHWRDSVPRLFRRKLEALGPGDEQGDGIDNGNGTTENFDMQSHMTTLTANSKHTGLKPVRLRKMMRTFSWVGGRQTQTNLELPRFDPER
ncbi:hypothetical protein DFH11DRAFT_210933 [Phellopilus nigrolimitatus]|nr:hypothetical protein DFH11DRAFT_210933 [Phellopilus nigrolimitatus]